MTKVKTVCIIDDDKIFTFATKRLLVLSDFCDEIIEFSNGEEAIKGLEYILDNEKNVPELIFLDLNMPIVDGWQFLDEFKSLKKLENTDIYIVSSSIDPADIKKSKTYKSVKDYITKPLDRSILQNIIYE